MIRKHKYTFFSLIFAVLFVFGSMIAMNGILKLRETRLLTESGRVKVESPVRAWLAGDSGEEPASDSMHQERYELTTQQMGEAISHWNSREGDIIHEPVAGQISMGEAIESGKEWFAAMGFADGSDDVLAYSVSATLSVGQKRETLNTKLEPYYSFWTVKYSNRIMEAGLLVNAVTGKVWGGKVTIYENIPENLHKEDAVTFWEMAGLQVSETDFVEVNAEQTWETYGAEDMALYAQIGYSYFNINEDSIVDYSNLDVFHKHYAIITYEFLVGKK